METARGRWFLGEYAKRNRNADTTMVLDAVARIEATMAAQKQPPDNTNDLADALVLIRGLLSEARADAAQAMSGPQAEEALATVNKGTRIIREIAWRLREYGTDARICDMLDAQIGAIEASHHVTMAPDKRDAVLAVFDLLIRRIGELGGSGSQPPSSGFEAAATPPVPHRQGAGGAGGSGAAGRDRARNPRPRVRSGFGPTTGRRRRGGDDRRDRDGGTGRRGRRHAEYRFAAIRSRGRRTLPDRHRPYRGARRRRR